MGDAPLKFLVPGLPITKGRPRAVRTAEGKVRVFTPRRTHAYEDLVRLHAIAEAKRSNWPFAFEGACAVSLSVTMPDRRRRDLDNVVKSILDGLQEARGRIGCVIRDDSQVAELHVYRTVDAARAGVEVTLSKLSEVR